MLYSFPDLVRVLNKLLASLDVEPLPPDVDEENLPEILSAIVDGGSGPHNASGPLSDVAMANRIARKQGVSFARVWRTMPRTGTCTLRNSGQQRPMSTSRVLTDDEVAARLKARGIDPKFMPRSG